MYQLNPDVATWSSTLKTNIILADIYDVLTCVNANLMAHATGKAAKNPKPYPRPRKEDPGNERHFGSGALPPDELREWFEEKRAENAGSSTGDHNRNTGT